MLDPANLGFRPLELADLPQMHRWLNTDFVFEWYYEEEEYTYENIEKEFIPYIRAEEPNYSYIITYAASPIGYIQCYRIHDYPEYAKYAGEAENAGSVDLFIGEADYLHQGLGAPILRCFLREIVFPTLEVVSCIIGPDEANEVAKKAYAKAGFKYLKTIAISDEPGPEYLMRLTRDEVFL
jgi:aminoglycoside 6'-N-acetyltransferase